MGLLAVQRSRTGGGARGTQPFPSGEHWPDQGGDGSLQEEHCRAFCFHAQQRWGHLFMLPKAVRLEFRWLNCLAILTIVEAVLAMDGLVYVALHKLGAQRTFQTFN